MTHLVTHFLIRLAIHPAFYWIGLAAAIVLTFGKAAVMPYSERLTNLTADYADLHGYRNSFREKPREDHLTREVKAEELAFDRYSVFIRVSERSDIRQSAVSTAFSWIKKRPAEPI